MTRIFLLKLFIFYMGFIENEGGRKVHEDTSKYSDRFSSTLCYTYIFLINFLLFFKKIISFWGKMMRNPGKRLNIWWWGLWKCIVDSVKHTRAVCAQHVCISQMSLSLMRFRVVNGAVWTELSQHTSSDWTIRWDDRMMENFRNM